MGVQGYLGELYAGFESSLARTRSLNHGRLLRISDMVGKLHKKGDICRYLGVVYDEQCAQERSKTFTSSLG